MIYIGFDSVEAEEKERKYDEYMENVKEIWKQVVYRGLSYPYEVSNKGNMRKITSKKKKKVTLCTYYRTGIKHPVTKEKHTINVHRLMALAFIPIPTKYVKRGMSENDLVPNHKDGIKTHNCLYNLEWVTYKENTQHAYANNLIPVKYGEDSLHATITNEDAIEICEMLQEGMSNKEISELMEVPTSIIHSIKGRKSWKQISKDYVFPRTLEIIPYTISDDDFINICEDIMNGVSGKKISEKYGVSKSYATMVINGDIRPEISTLYDFKKRKSLPKRQNDELIHEMCKDLEKNELSVTELSKKYEVSLSFISELKHRKLRPDISEGYNF